MITEDKYRELIPLTVKFKRETNLGGVMQAALGIAGEAIEFTENLETDKIPYDDVLKEAGDVFWYVYAIDREIREAGLYSDKKTVEYSFKPNTTQPKKNLFETVKKLNRIGEAQTTVTCEQIHSTLNYTVTKMIKKICEQYFPKATRKKQMEVFFTCLTKNDEKLRDRLKRDVINGDGDAR